MGKGGIDWDDSFSYSTIRYVRIRDRRLGFMNLFFQIAIFTYVVVYNVVLLQGYKQQGNIVGTARLQPQSPSDMFLKPAREYSYCGNGTYTSADGFVSSLPAFQCRFLDTYDTVYPAVESSALFLSTRINDTIQAILDPACANLTVPTCAYDDLATTTYYVPETELTTLLIDHTMSVPSLNFSKSSLDMTGSLHDSEARSIDPCHAYTKRGFPCPNGQGNFSFAVALGDQGEPDIIAVDTLLEAASPDWSGQPLRLDNIAGQVSKYGSETYRYAGIVFVVAINYDNYWSYDDDAVRYTYTVTQIPNSDFKAEEVVRLPTDGLPQRQILDRHGVRIVVSQGGKIGRFNLATLLVLLVSSMGLLAVSVQIVNFMAMNVLQMKHIYRQYQSVTSVDFSEIAHMKRSDLSRFRAEDLINPRPAIFESVGKDTAPADATASGKPAAAQVGRSYYSRITAQAMGPDERQAVINPLNDDDR